MVCSMCLLGQANQSNTNVGVAGSYFVDVISIYNQLTLSKGNYTG